MKKYLLGLFICLFPILLSAQLTCDIKVLGVSESSVSLCVGDDLPLDGTPAGGTLPYTHLWLGAGGQLSTTTMQSAIFTATTSGVYTVVYQVTDNTLPVSLVETDTIIITVNGLPNLFSTPNQMLCLGECVDLTAMTTTGDRLMWYLGFIGGPLVGSVSGTSLTVNVCPVVDTTYYALAVVSTTGCTKSKKVDVNVVDVTASINITNDTICKFGSTQLQAIAGGGLGPNYSYQWSPTSNIDNTTISNPTVWPTSTTTYCVTITDLTSSCTETACVEVAVYPQQLPEIKDTIICYGGCATLTASGTGVSWEWSTPPGGTTNSITVCPTANTTYTVTMTDSRGCTASESVVVTVNPNLTANAGNNQFICYGNCVQIGQAPLSATGGTPPYTYSWSSLPPSTISQIANPTVCPTVNTTYSLTVTDAAGNGGCFATDEVVITVNPNLIANAGVSDAICKGESKIIGGSPSASGGVSPYTYQWSPSTGLDNNSIPNPTATPLSTTTYTLLITDASSCTASSSITVTVNQIPLVEAGDAQLICYGNTISLGGTPTALGGVSPYTYLWTSNPVSVISQIANPSVTPIETTTYTLNVNDAVGCVASDQVEITVNPLLTVNAGAPYTICSGASHQIGGTPTASGGTPPYTYQWNPVGSLTNATIPNPTAHPLTTTTYCVTVTDASSCTASSCVTITVNTATATATATPSLICLGQTSTIVATGGGTYQWSTPPGGTTNSISVSPTTNSSYTVTVTATNGCSTIASANVTVSVVNASLTPASSTICYGNNTTITANANGGTLPYTYQWSPVPGNTATISVSPPSTTLYNVTITDANGCSGSASATINVITASLSAFPTSVCPGGTTTLTATGGGTYQWSASSETTSSIVVSPIASTTYTVTVINGSCTNTASVFVPVTIVTASATPVANPICLGECTDIIASGAGGAAPYSFQWSSPPGGTSSTINVCPTTNTIYTTTVTDANGCSGTVNSTVNVTNTTLTAVPSSVCLGGSSTITATGGGTYQWNNGSTTSSIVVTPTTTSTYTVTVVNGGCTNTGSITVIVNTLEIVLSADPNPICLGETSMLIVSGGLSYNWNNGETNDTIYVIPNTTTAYTVTATNVCTASATVTVVVNVPSANLVAVPSTVCAGSPSTLTASSGTAWVWNTTPPKYTQQITVNPTVTTNYCVTVTDMNGCTESACATINVTSLPLASISPAVSNICMGDCTTLTASGGGTYQWSNPPGGTTADILVCPTSQTNYTVTVTANGCSNTATALVNVTPYPTATITASKNPICQGETAVLTASGGTSYLWSSAETTSSISVNPNTTTNYSVTVSLAGCTSTATTFITLTVNPTPTVSITSTDMDNTICAGECVTYTAMGASTYLFNLNGTPVQGPGSFNTYTSCLLNNNDILTVIGYTNGCSASSAPIAMVVNPVPTTIITNVINPSMCDSCDGSMSEITTGGVLPYNIEWNNGATTESITKLCSDIYTVTVTDINGCSDFAVQTLNDPTPTVVLYSNDPNDSICSGDCITFTATGASTYQFYVNGIAQTLPTNINSFNSCSLKNGDKIDVKGTDDLGCSSFSESIIIAVNPLPSPFNVTGGGTFCSGSEGSYISLNGSQTNVVYSLWKDWTSLVNTKNGNGAAINFNPVTSSGTYSVIGQNLITGCQNNMIGDVSVVENNAPVKYIVTGGGSYCEEGPGLLVGLTNSDTGVIYQLLINSVLDTTVLGTGLPISFGMQKTHGVYKVIATDLATTCQTMMYDSAVITLYNLAKEFAVTGGGSYCKNSSGVKVGLSDSEIGITYQLICTPPGTVQVTMDGTGSAIDFGYQKTSGIYTVIGNNSFHCPNQMIGSVVVSIDSLPIADAGIDQTICQKSSTNLTGSGAGIGGYYIWTNYNINNSLIANPTVNPQFTTTYSLTVTDINGCSNLDEMIVNVLPVNIPIISATQTAFCDSSLVNATLSVGSYNSYTWNTVPQTYTSSITVNSAGKYTVSVTQDNGCTTSADYSINVYPPISTPIILTEGTTHICNGDSVKLYLNHHYYTYNWSSGSYNVTSIYASKTGSYFVTVTDFNNCKAIAGPQQVTVKELPEAIISYIDNDNASFTFDFYSFSLNADSTSWNFGDFISPENTSILNNASHNYTEVGTYKVTLIVSNDCGSDTAYVNINAHLPSYGIDEMLNISELALYPNPTKDYIQIDFKLKFADKIDFILYNMLGNQIYEESVQLISGKNHKIVDLRDLPKGVYFMKVISANGYRYEKIIKH